MLKNRDQSYPERAAVPRSSYENTTERRQNSARPSYEQSRDGRTAKGRNSHDGPQKDEDLDSKWIHRDKLAQIESQELREMSFRLGLPTHGGSDALNQSTGRAGRQRGRASNEIDRDGSQNEDKFSRVRLSGQGLRDSAGAENIYHRSIDGNRNLTSRWTSSTDMDTLDNRASLEPEVLDAVGAQTLSGQRDVSSAEPRSSFNAPERPAAPTNIKSPPSAMKNITQGTRQSAFKNSNSLKKRTPRQSADGGSRNNTNTKQSTAPTAQPEGEAPWIADMYKPDPRLPQDEQIIPTHAKRLAREKEDRRRVAPSPSGQPQSFLLESDDPESDDPDATVVRHNVGNSVQSSNVQDGAANTGMKTSMVYVAGLGNQHDSGEQSTNHHETHKFQKVLKPEETTNPEWPLSTSNKDTSPAKSRPMLEAANDKSSRHSDRGSYQLTPIIRTQEQMEQRLSQQTGLAGLRPPTHNVVKSTSNTNLQTGTSRFSTPSPDAPRRPTPAMVNNEKLGRTADARPKRRKRFLCF